jgi:hypothetical protein
VQEKVRQGARFLAHRDGGVGRLDTVSKSVEVVRHARRIRIVLQSSRRAFIAHGFTSLQMDASCFEQFLFVARHLHLSAIGK